MKEVITLIPESAAVIRKKLHWGRDTFRRFVSEEEIPYVLIGKKKLFYEKDILEALHNSRKSTFERLGVRRRKPRAAHRIRE